MDNRQLKLHLAADLSKGSGPPHYTPIDKCSALSPGHAIRGPCRTLTSIEAAASE